MTYWKKKKPTIVSAPTTATMAAAASGGFLRTTARQSLITFTVRLRLIASADTLRHERLRAKPPEAEGVGWCPWPDSNQHSLRNLILSQARLPIPPQGHWAADHSQQSRRVNGARASAAWRIRLHLGTGKR